MQTRFRTTIIHFLYRHVAKPIFFLFDPEAVHDGILAWGAWLGQHAFARRMVRALFYYEHPMLAQTLCGILYKNPVGLAAGFDKNGEITSVLPSVGFGAAEVGSITGEPCAGNPQPRLWRLKKSRGLVVYYGLKNDGCNVVVKRLVAEKNLAPGQGMVLGISIAKTNSPATVAEDSGIADYAKAFQTCVSAGVGDYYTINISCPNVFGGEPFLEAGKLRRLLSALRETKTTKPLYLKLAAELSPSQIDDIILVAREFGIAGFICANLAKNRSNSALDSADTVPAVGGMSGKPTTDLSNNLIRYIYQKTGNEFVIIGCGGIFCATDAYQKIRLGANAVQLITGMIFEGPQMVGDINYGLVQLLRRDGFSSITMARGLDAGAPVPVEKKG